MLSTKLKNHAGHDQIGAVWARLRLEAASASASEPMLASFMNAAILRHQTLKDAFAHRIAEKMSDGQLDSLQIHDIAQDVLARDPDIVAMAAEDMVAVDQRDPACNLFLQPFLYFKGFHALLCYRIAYWLYGHDRVELAYYLQSRISERFGVDIHPAAKVGRGIMIDHATAVIIGETAIVGDNVSLLHEVTLGGTGADEIDRHPKIGNGVLIGAGAKVLGNIKIGDEARIAAGSVVLQSVPPRCTVAGVPAIPVGGQCSEPAQRMDQTLVEN